MLSDVLMSTDKKTTQAYDNYAQAWAHRMRSGKNVAHTYLEKPAMYKKLGDVIGKSVLCIGCGTGEECERIKAIGAESVIGIDISKGLIEFARQSYPYLDFKVMDMEQLDFPDQSFDIVYSSLTMHYLGDWGKALAQISRVLRPGGRFLFSTHHPVKWGAEITRSKEKNSFLMGYTKSDSRHQIFGDYLNARKINDIWFGDFPVTYYHRPLSDIMLDIREAGFIITDFIEPKPTPATAKEKPVFYDIHSKIPLFMIFELQRSD